LDLYFGRLLDLYFGRFKTPCVSLQYVSNPMSMFARCFKSYLHIRSMFQIVVAFLQYVSKPIGLFVIRSDPVCLFAVFL
jgi:hypothetical protein